ncbi:MAG: Gfo/Idh/MocA family oxidoreductase [Candidatus Nanopelagicales bacterium]
MLTLTWIVRLAPGPRADAVRELRRALAEAGLVDTGPVDLGPTGGWTLSAAGDLRASDVVVVCADQPLPSALVAELAAPDLQVLLVGESLALGDPDRVLAQAAGVRIGPASPVHDVRLRVGPDGAHLTAAGHVHGDHAHHDEHEHLRDRVAPVQAIAGDVQVLRTARLGLVDHPVLTWRPATGTGVLSVASTPEAIGERTMLRLLVAVLREIAGRPSPAPVRVGLLGYGAIGAEHSRAVRAVDGLSLAAVCDTSPERLEVALAAAPGVVTSASAQDLIEHPDVDLVVISTPPSSHAQWALAALGAGKHVVIEKPFALTTEQADEVLAAARSAGLLAVVYQNRRFDPDHLAIQRLVRAGLLGEVFHVEAFVGGYGHPCNLWHSDESVSGGAFYDWGAHLLDQVLDLMPAPIEYVTAAVHKRAWFDVTNADHSRVTLRFTDGAEAEFIHSDLAAALKPRWYLLGTRGAVVGRWRTEKVVSRSDIGTLVEDVLAPADSPPLIDLHAAEGSVTRVATPPGPAHQFHRDLADRLRFGLPMSVTGEQSRRVLSVMQAATQSAADSGRPVVPA